MMANDRERESIFIEDFGTFLLNGEINDDSCGDAIRFILESNYRKQTDNHWQADKLSLLINSEGGDVSSGFSLISIMQGSNTPIRTVGLGVIASMGLMIFIAGQERILTPSTLIMSHQYTSWNDGKEHELLASVKKNKLISNMVMRHYKRYTKLSEKDIKKYLLPPSDVYLTASEAKKYGICDTIKEFNGK